jgi:polar amino acid transport system substrate-binding protein
MGTIARIAAAAALVVALAGCQGIPADPDGGYERITGGTLRVGVTHNPPWTDTSGGEPSGSEVQLVQDWADELDARVDFTEGSESVLVDALERGELDVVIGGFRDDSPWLDKAALTAPYDQVTGPDGAPEQHVMLTPLGENRLLVALETYLQAH